MNISIKNLDYIIKRATYLGNRADYFDDDDKSDKYY
jgi:hypothetical protein